MSLQCFLVSSWLNSKCLHSHLLGVLIGQAKLLQALSKETLFLVNANSLSVCTLGQRMASKWHSFLLTPSLQDDCDQRSAWGYLWGHLRCCKFKSVPSVRWRPVSSAIFARAGIRKGAVLGFLLPRLTGRFLSHFRKPQFLNHSFTSAWINRYAWLQLCLRSDCQGHVAASTEDLVFRTLVPYDLTSFHFFRVPGIIDSSPTGMKFDKYDSDWPFIGIFCEMYCFINSSLGTVLSGLSMR